MATYGLERWAHDPSKWCVTAEGDDGRALCKPVAFRHPGAAQYRRAILMRFDAKRGDERAALVEAVECEPAIALAAAKDIADFVEGRTCAGQCCRTLHDARKEVVRTFGFVPDLGKRNEMVALDEATPSERREWLSERWPGQDGGQGSGRVGALAGRWVEGEIDGDELWRAILLSRAARSIEG